MAEVEEDDLSNTSQLLIGKDNKQRYSNEYNIVNIHLLESETCTDTSKMLLVGQLLYIKRPAPHENLSFNNRFGRSGAAAAQGHLTYERMLMCNSITAPPGNNLFAVLVGRGQNETFWNALLSERNSSKCSPGFIFVVESPQCIERWMTKSRIPILNSDYPVQRVNTIKASLPEVPVVEPTTKQQAFFHKGVNLTISNAPFLKINCNANQCDGIESYKDQVLAQYCACSQATNRDANIVTAISGICSKAADGLSFAIKFFTSKKFTSRLMKGGRIPVGITVERLTEDLDVRTALDKSVRDQIKYINEHGGFDVLGWVCRGTVRDQGVDQPSPAQRNEAPRYIESDELLYHVSLLEPSKKLKAEEEQALMELKFDAEALLQNKKAKV